jgi:formylglycine-generating enzyme required for sulfatase activity
MNNTRPVFIIILFFMMTALMSIAPSCTKMGDEKVWNNPYDSLGVNWSPPSIVHHNDTTAAINDTVKLFASGSDENGYIAGYAWSFDHGALWDTAWLPAMQPHIWKQSETGAHVVWVRSVDNDGLVSAIDSFVVNVHSYVPVIAQVRDTVVSQLASVAINVVASDTNSDIGKYYWGDSTGSWTDSTDVPQKVFTHPQGGPLIVRWGVVDDDGNCVTDTFTLLFNRGPVSIKMVEPSGIVAPFLSYNYVTAEGGVRFSYTATDPDGDADTLTYKLYLGTASGNMPVVYDGRNISFIAENIQALTMYYWKLVVRDLFGDSLETSGFFTMDTAPGAPVGMSLIRSGSQSFVMGQTGYDSSEAPKHTVSFSYHFWMDSTEVTGKKFAAVMGLSSSLSNDSAMLPDVNCTWFDAVLYCNARSRKENRDTVYSYQSISGTAGNKCILTGVSADLSVGGYRLPTEAEWEYACRGNTQTLFFWSDDQIDAETYAWLEPYSDSQAHVVANKGANAFGLFDMAGNVWEWCNDWFGARYYTTSPTTDPSGPATGQERVIRGGSFQNAYYFAQSGTRSKVKPSVANTSIGFRTVLINK